MMRKRLAVTMALFAALTCGCRGSRKKIIGVVPKATSHIFWVSVQTGVRAAERDLGVEVLWNGPPTETDYARQIQIVDSLVARRVDGIAIAASERKALIAPIDRAMAAGIPVTVFDSGLDSTNYTTFVATDNYEAGQTGARTLAKLVGGKGPVGMVMHAPGSVSTTDRERGFEDVIAKEFPDIKIVARQFGMASRARSRDAAENILAAHPNIVGLFASTEPSAAGTALALKGRGLNGKVKFVGFDSDEGLIEDLKGGTIDALVVQDPFRMGYEAVRTLVDKLNGKEPPKRIDLKGVVVSRDNLANPEIQTLLNPKAAAAAKQ